MIGSLAYRNCVGLTHARWRSDVQLLLEPLRRLVGSSGQVQAVAARDESKAAQAPFSPSVSVPSNSSSITTSRFDPVTLPRIRRELALCIGPIADVGVSRAARVSNSIDELLLKVAEEIGSPQRREEFLRKTSSLPASSVAVGPASPRESSRPQPTPRTAEEIDAEPSSPPPALASPARSAPSWSSSKKLRLVIAGVIGIALLGFLIVKVMQGPAGARSSTPRESPPQQSKPESSPENAPSPEQSPLPEPETLKASQPVATVASQRVSLPSGVSKNLLVKEVVPTYPPLARKARIHGEVVLDVDISREGAVESLKAVSGHRMLIPAAIDAVKNWRNKP